MTCGRPTISESALAAILVRKRRRRSSTSLDAPAAALTGWKLLDMVKALDADLPVIMISGHGNIETAVSRSSGAPTSS